jgi:hypothetical protein
MFDAEAHILEVAIQPTQCSQFSLADSQGTIQKHKELFSNFELG